MPDGGESTSRPIPAECRVHRLIKGAWVKPAEFGDGDRPTSQSFSDSDEDGCMSVFLADDMDRAGVTVVDLLKCFPEYEYCCSWTVKQLNDLGETVVRQPIDEFPGHAGVARSTGGSRGAKARRRLAVQAEWSVGPSGGA